MAKKLHIAIDGPVAAGKGTVASKVAQKLGILYAETGAMYRAVALMGMREKVDLTNEDVLLTLLTAHTLELAASKNNPGTCQIFLDGEDVTEKIRTPEVSRNSSIVAALPRIREYLVEKQKLIAQGESVVMEGRDIGTVVLPDADVKVFLTADPVERAKRRREQLAEKGVNQSFETILEETKKRDEQDMQRAINPLQVSKGALVIDTTNLSIDQVVEKIITLTKKLMIHIKSDKEILAMQEGGEKLKRVLESILLEVKPGVSPLKLDALAEKLVLRAGGVPSFKKVPGYKWTTCMCINDIVVHGIPYDKPLEEGDVLGLDVGMFFKGFHTDASWSVIVGDAAKFPDKKRFLAVGEEALYAAIKQVTIGNRIGIISEVIQNHIEKAGYSIVPELVGHGVGKKLHEDPEIPGLVRTTINKTPLIKPGMALAVEVIYSHGKPDIYLDEDGWTIRTKDGTLSGLFEKTVIATNHGVLVLT